MIPDSLAWMKLLINVLGIVGALILCAIFYLPVIRGRKGEPFDELRDEQNLGAGIVGPALLMVFLCNMLPELYALIVALCYAIWVIGFFWWRRKCQKNRKRETNGVCEIENS